MDEQIVNPDTQPWYRQGWPWALMALPASAVIGGIVTIVLAVQSPNALVVDDYYKQGLAINQEKQRIAAAERMELTGLLRYDGRRIQVELSHSRPLAEKTLLLQVIHATRADLDRTLILQQNGDGYAAELTELRQGSWYLRLRPPDQSWEIRDKIVVEGSFQTLLTAQD